MRKIMILDYLMIRVFWSETRDRFTSSTSGSRVQKAYNSAARFSSLLSLCGVLGCTTISVPTGVTPVTPPGYPYLTGNWEFQLTPTSHDVPFATLAGFIYEGNEDPGVKDSVTASLQGTQPSSCYVAATLVPLQGTLTGTSLGLYSFSINFSYISITATKNAAGTQLTGTYGIGGGCASGSTGTLTGIKYAIVNGNYAGTLSNSGLPIAITITALQNANGNGDGTFDVSGSATFTGVSCFSQGSIVPGGATVIGKSISLNYQTNEGTSQVKLIGTIDQAANTITITSANTIGGACSGSLGSGAVSR